MSILPFAIGFSVHGLLFKYISKMITKSLPPVPSEEDAGGWSIIAWSSSFILAHFSISGVLIILAKQALMYAGVYQ